MPAAETKPIIQTNSRERISAMPQELMDMIFETLVARISVAFARHAARSKPCLATNSPGVLSLKSPSGSPRSTW
jgi:hypothetical protein